MTHNFLNKQQNPYLQIGLIVLFAFMLSALSGMSGMSGFSGSAGDKEAGLTQIDAASADSLSENGISQTEPVVLGRLYPSLREEATTAPELSAKAYIVYDTESGKLLSSYQANEPLAIASLTKLTTAIAASLFLSPDEEILINEAMAARNIPTPKLGLQSGEKIRAEDLVEGMLVGSANDAAEAIAYAIGGGDRAIGIEQMNDVAKSLGLNSTHYANPTGFDDSQAYSTASDVLATVLEVYRNPWLMSVLERTGGQVSSVDGTLVHKFRTTSSILRDKTNSVIAGKTGFTDEALGNLAVFAKSPNDSVIIAVLLGSQNRESDMNALLSWVYTSYQWK